MSPATDAPVWTNPQADLAIDVHAHVFNASDLQISPFLNLVAARQSSGLGNLAKLLGPVLNYLSWHVAPSAENERTKLARIAGQLAKCDPGALPAPIVAIRQQQYDAAKRQLEVGRLRVIAELHLKGSRRELGWDALPNPLERGLKAIEELPSHYEALAGRPTGMSPELFLLERTPASVLRFVIEMFQYRYASFLSYLETYSTGRDRPIDLVGSAMVDYDWWLAKGAATPSSLSAQVELMAELAVATRGRVHAWAPFCPFREVMYRRGRSPSSSLAFVQTAVRSQGALGVKLYPPMGFAPLGNVDLPRAFWSGAAWLPDDVRNPTFGADLDRALSDLYRWCAAEEVPILAHASNSNGPSDAFQDLALAPGWARVLDRGQFPDLRVDFGHLGGAGSTASPDRAQAFIALMGPPGQRGAHAYADASYFSTLLERPDDLRAVLQKLFDGDAGRLHLLRDRFLFGTDWKMLLSEAEADSYVERFERVIGELGTHVKKADASGLRGRFFAGNAVDFLGLRKGERSRTRLEQFYSVRKVKTPEWIPKVDATA